MDDLAPVRIAAPDIEPHRAGNTGIEFVSTFESGVSGPHAMLSAVVHGNELCGAIVLDELLRQGFRPARGRLTFAFMNVEAYARFDPDDPAASRYVDEDFNRLWSAATLDGKRESSELRRARAVRPIIDTVEYLLDIHSMTSETVPLMLAGPRERGRVLACALGVPPHVVCDEGHAAGPRMRDYAPFIDPDGDRNALLVECGQHWAPETVDVARAVTLRFLAQLDMLAQGFVAADPPGPAAQRVIEVSGPVTVRTPQFRFAADYRGLDVIDKAGTVIGWDGDEAVRTPYDDCVLIMPSRRLEVGQSAVRLGRFV